MTIPAGQLIVLDTMILVDLVRNNDRGQKTNERFKLTEGADRPLFSSVTEGEIFGLARLPRWRWGEPKLRQLEELLANLGPEDPRNGEPIVACTTGGTTTYMREGDCVGLGGRY